MIMTIPSTQRKKSIDSSIHFSSQGGINPELIVFLQNVEDVNIILNHTICQNVNHGTGFEAIQ